MSQSKKSSPTQLELPLREEAIQLRPAKKIRGAHPPRRMIKGEARRRKDPPILSRDGLVRVLIEAAADLLLRRITSERAEEIRRAVDRIMTLFDRVDASPELMPVLKRQLDGLESLMRETRAIKARKGR